MKRIMLKSKIHNATVIYANLNYEGSITIDENFMRAADLIEYEKVAVVNKNTGDRFETYVIKGEKDSKIIGLNGAAARLGYAGDKLIIFSFTEMEDKDLKDYKPVILKLGENNTPIN